MSAIKAFELARLRLLREEFAARAAAGIHHKRATERAHEIAERQSARPMCNNGVKVTPYQEQFK
jgi:hypothetical protein